MNRDLPARFQDMLDQPVQRRHIALIGALELRHLPREHHGQAVLGDRAVHDEHIAGLDLSMRLAIRR